MKARVSYRMGKIISRRKKERKLCTKEPKEKANKEKSRMKMLKIFSEDNFKNDNEAELSCLWKIEWRMRKGMKLIISDNT